MEIKVTQNEVKINKDILNDGEYNIHKCQFDFDEEYNGLVQKAVFTLNDGTPYLMTIVNNECNIPIEVLEEGVLKIGVYAYETNNDELVLRYSPSPDIIHVFDGSYVKDAQNTEPITPTDKEQIEQAITDLQNDVTDLEESKQDTLVSGENIKTINGESVLGSGNIEIDLSNYYNKQEIDQSQASQNANISKNTDDIATLNNNLTNYSLITETGSQIVLNVNPSNYQMTAILKDKNGNTIYTSNVIDLPIESMIVNVTYDSTTKEIVFTLQNGTTLRVSVADLVSGLVSTDELNTILASYYTKTEIDNLLSGKVDTTTYTQGQATQDANIEENASNIDWLQTLVNQMPTVSGQGTDLSLESVLNYRLMKFLPQGNSSQDGEPTPTTPIPVKRVTGENSLKLSNKNLLNITTSLIANRTNQGVTTNVNNNQSVTLTGTWNNSATQKRYFTSSDNDKILFPAGTYTLSSSPLTVRLEIRKVSSTSRITVDGTFTSEEDFYITNGTFILTYNQTYNTDITIMLEKGSSATDYAPYEEQNYRLSFGNMEFNSSPDGTIRDYIYGTPDNWYKREYIGKVVLDGSENYSTVGTNTTDKKRIQYSGISNLIKKPENNSTLAKIICSHFVNKTANQTYALEQGISVSSVGNVIVYDLDNQEGNTTVFKEWLSNNNMTILYEKVEYTDIPITDATLINQLNDIYNNAHSYNGTTNITTTYEDGNEQMYLDIEALKNVWEVTE